MGIEFADCASNGVDALRGFFRQVYRADYPLGSSPTLFEWQFGRRRDDSGYCCKLVLVDGDIAGCLGYVPVEVSLRGRVVRGAWTANWIVNPEYRRLGLGPLLMRELTRQVDVTLVVGLSDDSRAILPRMGWTDFGDLARYVKVLDRQAINLLTPGGSIDWSEQDAPLAEPIDRQTDVRSVERFDDGAMRLWDHKWGTRGAGTRRSAEFLNWRYVEHPAFSYRLFEARRDRELLGLAVYRVEPVRDVPLRIGRLVEFLAEPHVSDALIGALLRDATSQGVSAVDFFCSQRDINALLQWGFLPGDHPVAAQIPILFQPIDRRRCGIPFMAYLNNLAVDARSLQWYVTKGDGDQDRPN